MSLTLPQPQTVPPVLERADRRPTYPFFAICIYLFIVFLGAALIAPRLYASAQFLAEEISRRFFWLASQPFHRFVNRCLLVLAILGLPFLLKAMGIRSAAALGIKPGLRHFGEAIQGFAWGFIPLAVLTALLVGSNARVLDLDHPGYQWVRHLKNAALAGFAVALIEEVLFRGALFSGLRRRHPFWIAALASGALYALLHFFEKPENPRFVEWNSGLIVLAQMLRGFADWNALIPAFLNLTLLGMILALGFERTGALHFSFGLHASLVFWIKSFAFLTDRKAGSVSSFWGSDKLVDGWAAGLVLLALYCLIQYTLPQRRSVP